MRKKKKIIVSMVLAVGVFCLGIFLYMNSRMTPDKAWNELLSLDKNITMEQLNAKGYINVDAPLDEQNEEIEMFLNRSMQPEHKVLRIAKVIDGKLCAKILLYEEQWNIFRMWTMYPNMQAAEDPGKWFLPDPNREEKDGVVSVILVNTKNLTMPVEQTNFIDEVLYAYKAE